MNDCECCGRADQGIVGVASIPGVAMSIRWCRACLDNGAVPEWVAGMWLEEIGRGGIADWARAQSVFKDGEYRDLFAHYDREEALVVKP